MKRINPIHILIVLNIVVILFRDLIFQDSFTAAIGNQVELLLATLGVFGYVSIVVLFVLCSFFFVPLLIPLNILCGALYGAYIGTGVALIGITFGCIASTVSARYVFTGMQLSIDKRPGLQRLLDRAADHRNLAIIMVRFAVVVPYLFQNLALAATRMSITRLAVVTSISAIPGAAIYSFLGAGLVQADDARELVVYLAVPVVTMLAITGAMAFFRTKYGDAVTLDASVSDAGAESGTGSDIEANAEADSKEGS